MATLRTLWQLHNAAGEAPAVVRVKNLQATVKGPNDAWGRQNRPQTILISCEVELRQPFRSTSSTDALQEDTVHYGQLSKAIMVSLERLAVESSPEVVARPRHLSEVLTRIWIDLTGIHPAGTPDKNQEPFLKNLAAVRCIKLTGLLPKASLVGDGPSLTFTGVFDNDVNGTPMPLFGRTLRLHNLVVPTLIGINDNEKKAKQTAVVSVEIDHLEATADEYNIIESKIVERMESSSFGTLEALATALAETITLCLGQGSAWAGRSGTTGSQLKITVAKPIAVVFADAPSVVLRINTRDVNRPGV
ncbi:dihydropteroate synthase [Drechmeria coniospora]|uniref:dihydroneopterin aldolase n=1 Tax=Drechmeria coniospora TaxID=98403 RepID=A0A151GKP7_DRECN|nr:dihydropteroate synthase [Drechmeria coniospora]KYK57685.1 dihydropteroate synthase [Drechmeria coniospora]